MHIDEALLYFKTPIFGFLSFTPLPPTPTQKKKKKNRERKRQLFQELFFSIWQIPIGPIHLGLESSRNEFAKEGMALASTKSTFISIKCHIS